ncbi:MAG: hypothetical protein E7311_00570 [Clostridiales bacterium]|nr:hypothetical protein [Clostridiales bacterium]
MKKGFSLIMLGVTISVMLIIVGTIILSTNKMSDEAKALVILDEMKILQAKILEYQLKHEDDANLYPYLGEKIIETNKITLGNITYGIGENTGYYLLEPSNLKEMNISNINNIYLVNYMSQDIVYKDGISINGTMYYTIDEIDRQANVFQK